ncbi:hypothetical protein P7K49_019836 [Saguinus oedipus]|uniref:Uncharacterized protein n=1 Tax=Saguinus oedipus TaxID=9490 RepID=A0ABQ9UYI1_SAGOE|nr:hypothetical protein P7K49_019836 [Saguinus oedipus]
MAWALKLPLADEVIESGLVQDFDASLSGIGQELGAGAYSMRTLGNWELVLNDEYWFAACGKDMEVLDEEVHTAVSYR